ncbi:hypothetical protein [Stenotrophomonas sp. MMGLT7]|uniref:hypothetical protein n=1 Tax=Stenotrophomonas sp. MMGLT7 TaxID=2901227 RepID=UPI001E2CC2C6|nr:hypothetical protein [Stenotrophomonas sp. MMGLT7]MCD7098933.1 hypothetical protein [Stenotrophomonas sp. MMGLT7]
MTRKPDATGTLHQRLFEQVRADDLDAAIAAGLMDYTPAPADEPGQAAVLLAAQRRLRDAWAARERYRARAARLQRRAAEREARRRAVAAAAAPAADSKPALPPAVAAVLARAKAKAEGRSSQ